MSLLRFMAVSCVIICGTKMHKILALTESDNTWLSISANEAFSYFIEHKNHLLDVGKVSTFLVSLISECALRCTRLASCLSFNIEEASLHRTEILCELLAEDLHNASRHFQRSQEFHHWSKIVSNCFLLHICHIINRAYCPVSNAHLIRRQSNSRELAL